MTTGEGWIGDLFVSGYSQGGHAAAAIQKELENNWGLVYPVTASTPMSGLYSLSGVMFDRIISDEIYYTPAYVAYIVLAYQEVYGNIYTNLSDIFKPAYVPIIENFHNHIVTTTILNVLLENQIFLEIGVSKPKIMFQDAALQDIINNVNNPLRVALRNNDLYDWTPYAPTRLYYCTADELVPYENSIVADSVMQANGAPDVAAVNFGALSHGGCAPLAIDASITFFDAFLNPCSTQDPQHAQTGAIVSNPVSEALHLLPEFSDVSSLSILDLTGHLVLKVTDIDKVSLSGIPAGIYLLQAYQHGNLYQQKIVIINSY